MSIINPDHLLDQADRLLVSSRPGALRQTDIRRAYSSAYYALFHAILNATADEIVGTTNRGLPQWALVCRSVSHRHLRELCEAITKSSMPKKFKPFSPNMGFGQQIETISEAFVDLQEKRMAADYDPLAIFLRSDAEASTSTARTAIARLTNAPNPARYSFLYLVAFPPRSQNQS